MSENHEFKAEKWVTRYHNFFLRWIIYLDEFLIEVRKLQWLKWSTSLTMLLQTHLWSFCTPYSICNGFFKKIFWGISWCQRHLLAETSSKKQNKTKQNRQETKSARKFKCLKSIDTAASQTYLKIGIMKMVSIKLLHHLEVHHWS